MSIFTKFIDDVFKNEDFLEYFSYKGENFPCIVSPIQDGIAFSEAGVESTENFTLDCKINLHNKFKANDRIIFRGKNYKISSIETDSANASQKLYIIALSKAI